MPYLPPQEPQESASEVHKLPLPPVVVKIWNLNIEGKGGGSPYIIKDDEAFSLSLDVKFEGGPLVDLLLCTGLDIAIEFAIEGFGTATEVNLAAPVVTTSKGQDTYRPTLNLASPASVGLTPGVYKTAAVMTVKPTGCCADIGPVAFGYITDVVFQVYAH